MCSQALALIGQPTVFLFPPSKRLQVYTRLAVRHSVRSRRSRAEVGRLRAIHPALIYGIRRWGCG